MAPNFLDAAKAYFDRGYTPIPLTLDVNGFPKRPISGGWSSLRHNWPDIEALAWGDAKGIGLPLGIQSGDVAVIDIDDNDMARAVIELFRETGKRGRLVETIRKRLHVYVRETTVSRSTPLNVSWRGNTTKVELKSTGNQVAAPPTPGYTLLDDSPPPLVPSVASAWESIARHIGAETLLPAGGKAGYPRPWQPKVGKEERNRSAYVEAHALRDARTPLDVALSIMRARFDADYAPGGISWGEIERTVKSAYAKGEKELAGRRLNGLSFW